MKLSWSKFHLNFTVNPATIRTHLALEGRKLPQTSRSSFNPDTWGLRRWNRESELHEEPLPDEGSSSISGSAVCSRSTMNAASDTFIFLSQALNTALLKHLTMDFRIYIFFFLNSCIFSTFIVVDCKTACWHSQMRSWVKVKGVFFIKWMLSIWLQDITSHKQNVKHEWVSSSFSPNTLWSGELKPRFWNWKFNVKEKLLYIVYCSLDIVVCCSLFEHSYKFDYKWNWSLFFFSFYLEHFHMTE